MASERSPQQVGVIFLKINIVQTSLNPSAYTTVGRGTREPNAQRQGGPRSTETSQQQKSNSGAQNQRKREMR